MNKIEVIESKFTNPPPKVGKQYPKYCRGKIFIFSNTKYFSDKNYCQYYSPDGTIRHTMNRSSFEQFRELGILEYKKDSPNLPELKGLIETYENIKRMGTPVSEKVSKAMEAMIEKTIRELDAVL